MSYLKTPKVSAFSHLLKVTCKKTKVTHKEAANVNHINWYGKKSFSEKGKKANYFVKPI